jgi:hypothetical protein
LEKGEKQKEMKGRITRNQKKRMMGNKMKKG